MSSKYCIFAEAPGKDEVLQNSPLVGAAGSKFWQIMNEMGLYREQFLIINSVNCRPVIDGKNGKPTLEEMGICSDWVRKYIRIIKPEKMLVMGTYAIGSLNTMLGEQVFYNNSIVKESGTKKFIESYYGIPLEIVCSVHPAWALIYNPVEGLEKLKEAIGIFNEDRPVPKGIDIHQRILVDPERTDN